MSVTSQLCLRVTFDDHLKCERLKFYLDPDTRPDFPDEVPDIESDWVGVFELLPDPCLIDLIDDCVVSVYFDDESDADPHQICTAIALLQPTGMLSWEMIEGEVIFQQWQGGDNMLLYAPGGLEDPEDDKKYNRKLDQVTRSKLDELIGMPVEALQFLANTLPM
jgi:hypothetical protein